VTGGTDALGAAADLSGAAHAHCFGAVRHMVLGTRLTLDFVGVVGYVFVAWPALTFDPTFVLNHLLSLRFLWTIHAPLYCQVLKLILFRTFRFVYQVKS
jgi:hypothetical protein